MIEEIRRRLQSYQHEEYDPEGRPRAAVLVALHERDGDLHVILTLRTNMVEEHKGQISFPGGAMEPRDGDMSVTALRESDEEIGLRSEHVKLIGRVDDYVMGGPGRFHISVFVGEIDSEHCPYAWTPAPAEVAEVLEVPLAHLLDPDHRVEHLLERQGAMHAWPAVRFGEHIIWGATWDMLRNFLDVAVVGAVEPAALS
jgi:8-oxo-dGTP pyrophosphatase MutT (NUDIX family)